MNMTMVKNSLRVLLGLLLLASLSLGYSTRTVRAASSWPTAIAAVLEQTVVATKHPTPILTVAEIPWASHYLEHPQIIKVGNTYHMYFHVADVTSYKIGHASASSITGPWTADALPIVTTGAPGEWDDGYVATPYVMEISGTYYMWYSGYDGVSVIDLGLATSSSPNGPFTKYGPNPLSGVAAWVGSVQLVGGTYYMLGGAEDGQSLWTASAPEGPWSLQNQPFAAGDPGTWNAVGSMGEGGLLYVDGLWYMFFGGRNAYPDPPDQYNARPFNLGLAVSEDTLTWYEYPDNPIILHGDAATDDWDEFRLSEIGAYYEDGTFYITYTGIGDAPGWSVWSEAGLATVTLSDSTFLWWDSSWGQRKVLVFNASSLTSDLLNFPVRVELSNSNFDFSQAASDGADIRFVDRHSTSALPYEIEWWDAGAESAVMWVNVPEVDYDSNYTDYFYMYWENGLATDAQTPGTVWGDYEAIDYAEATTDWSGTSLSLDGGDKIEGNYSLVDTVASAVVSTNYSTIYDPTAFVVGGIDLSVGKAYWGNSLDFWLKSDRASTAFTWARLYVNDLDGNYRYWDLTFPAGSWTNIVKNVSYGDGESGTPPNLMLIDEFELNFRAADVTGFYKKVDQVEKRWGAVGVWHFDEMTGSSTEDSTRYNNDGSLGSGAAWNNYDIDFDGTIDGVVTITDSDSLDIVSGLTIAAWANETVNGATWAAVLDKGGGNVYTLQGYASANQEISGVIKTGGGVTTSYSLGAQGFASTSTWYGIAAVYDRPNSKMLVYNGGTDVTDGTFAKSGDILTDSNAVTIGNRFDFNFPLNGLIDEVRLYGYVRSPLELATGEMNRLDTLLYHGGESPSPGMTTLAASDVRMNGGTHATLRGTLDDFGGVSSDSVDIRFEWGYDTNYSNTAGAQTVSSLDTYTHVLAGFDPDKTVYYRFVGTGALGTTYSEGASLKTPTTTTYTMGRIVAVSIMLTALIAAIALVVVTTPSVITIVMGLLIILIAIIAASLASNLLVLFWG